MIASCVADAAAAVARGSSATVTMPGSNVVSVVCSNARQAPITNTTASNVSRVITPNAVPIASVAVASPQTRLQIRTIMRRS